MSSEWSDFQTKCNKFCAFLDSVYFLELGQRSPDKGEAQQQQEEIEEFQKTVAQYKPDNMFTEMNLILDKCWAHETVQLPSDNLYQRIVSIAGK